MATRKKQFNYPNKQFDLQGKLSPLTANRYSLLTHTRSVNAMYEQVCQPSHTHNHMP